MYLQFFSRARFVASKKEDKKDGNGRQEGIGILIIYFKNLRY